MCFASIMDRVESGGGGLRGTQKILDSYFLVRE
jgi:hypothetical protein